MVSFITLLRLYGHDLWEFYIFRIFHQANVERKCRENTGVGLNIQKSTLVELVLMPKL